MLLFHFDGTAATDFGIGYDAETDKLSYTWGTNYSYSTFDNTLNSNSGILTFTVSFGDQGTRSWDSNGAFWSTFNLRGDIDSNEISTIVVSADGAKALDGLVVWDKDIDWIPNDSSKTGVDSATMATKTAIFVVPEPSAFGLLAGLGALALVGARRRRR